MAETNGESYKTRGRAKNLVLLRLTGVALWGASFFHRNAGLDRHHRESSSFPVRKFSQTSQSIRRMLFFV